MSSFLKAYQEKWVIDIYNARDNDELFKVLELILSDDNR